jgi:hypothetical protein
MERLQRKLQAELAPGTRVVSHDYPFRSWTPQRVVALDVPEKIDYTGRRSTALYLTAMHYNRGLDRDKDGIACEKH